MTGEKIVSIPNFEQTIEGKDWQAIDMSQVGKYRKLHPTDPGDLFIQQAVLPHPSWNVLQMLPHFRH